VLNTNSGRRVDALSATATETTLTGGSAALPMFTDGGTPYTGIIASGGTQRTGLAGRISVNGALLADPSRLVVFQTAPLTPAGDATRPSFILDQLTNTQFSFSRSTGVGGTSAPFHGTMTAFTSQMLSQQSQAAIGAANLKQGQDLVVSALQQRFTDASGVNVDTEMARLLTLQTAYGANARVMTAIKQMLDTLMQM
jgi:flagellar hook-associated protein 1 FlgK